MKASIWYAYNGGNKSWGYVPFQSWLSSACFKFKPIFVQHKGAKIQGVLQYYLHFCFVNFLASNEPRCSILEIFQKPFPCRFKSYPICYYSVKWWLRYCQNTKESHFKNYPFFCLLPNQELEHSRSLRNNQVQSRAPMITQEHLRAPWSLITTHEHL